ncbi:MAG: hypothetical protein Q7J54_07405 [Candidatus Woesearchaeota archaeon]|nr:hypothetical protein [Candidatus Woesearchaeota archaeon]
MSGYLTTSYFMKKEKDPDATIIAICRKSLPFIPRIYERMPFFGPSVELLRQYKAEEMGWEQYREIYKNEQRAHFKERPDDFRNLLKRARLEKIILCCYEKTNQEKNNCHRYLLFEILKQIAQKERYNTEFVEEK